MPFPRIDATDLPPRQWAIVGHPGSGKSSFAAQMAGPLLVVDSDHRFSEVAGLATGEVFSLSSDPADHVDAERITAQLRANMPGSGVRTIVIDSLTSILSPLVVEAVLDNDAGRNKNRISAFKDKALAMRLLQDIVTGWGCDTLWIYHLRSGRDEKANLRETTSISIVELTRLRRSLNMQLSVVQDGERRGVRVDWARRGRSGALLWDDSGRWLGMPERIEKAVYGGLTSEQMNAIEHETPESFTGPADAIAWAVDLGIFRDAVHGQNAYEKLKREVKPATAPDMWRAWVADVERRRSEKTV